MSTTASRLAFARWMVISTALILNASTVIHATAATTDPPRPAWLSADLPDSSPRHSSESGTQLTRTRQPDSHLVQQFSRSHASGDLARRQGCIDNLIITGNVRYAEPGCSDGVLYSTLTRNTTCTSKEAASGAGASPTPPAPTACVDLPLRRARVELWIASFPNDVFLFATTTDALGDFEFCLHNNNPGAAADFYVVVLPCPDGTDDGDACGSLQGVPYPYSVRAGATQGSIYVTFSSLVTGVCTGTVHWDIVDRRAEHSGAMHVYDLLANDAYDYLQNEVSWTNDFNLQASFPEGPTSFSAAPVTVHVAQNDQQDPDLVLKAYSEFVLYELYGGTPPPVTTDCASHDWGVLSDPGCALTHGLATFLQAAMQGDAVFEDTPSPGAVPTVQIDMELPDPPVASNADEGAVAASVWDMFDPANEGHDLISVGLPALWNVIEQDQPLDFCEFALGYVAANGASQELDDILLHHTTGCLICLIPGAAPRQEAGFYDTDAAISDERSAARQGPLVRYTRLSTRNAVSKPDIEGNRFYITYESNCYFCLNFKPAGEPARMVGKCPWVGGCNTSKLYYVPQPGTDIPAVWLRSEHFSYDFDRKDTARDCNTKGGHVYSDDIPDPPGYFDWVSHKYSVCDDELKVTQYRDPAPDLHNPEVADVVHMGPAVIGCSGSAFPPTIACKAPAVATLPDSTMGDSSAEILLAGDPTGGTITFVAGSRSVSVSSQSADTIDDVALALAAAINSTPEFAPAGLAASASGALLTVSGAGNDELSITTDDVGIAQPASPADFVMVDAGSTVVLSWANADAYDRLQLSKGDRSVAMDIPGGMTTELDSLLLDWPGDYVLVGWKNGMPSAPVVATPGISAPPTPHSRRFNVRTYPNPSNPSTQIVFDLARGQDISLAIYDVRGRRVRQLLRERRPAGTHSVEWDGRDDEGATLPSGVYVYELRGEGARASGKMALLK